MRRLAAGRYVRRVALLTVSLGALTVIAAPAASAHTVSGQGATNYRTMLIGVVPAVPGLSVKSIDLGSYLELTWTGRADLYIEGYQDEPYYRIGPSGVFRNRLSPATYLNAVRLNPGPVPAYASATVAPVWVKQSSGHTVTWHDHRTHWMGGPTPPAVAAAPHQFHRVTTWAVSLVVGGAPDPATVNGLRQWTVVGGTPIALTGTLDWVPGSDPWGWVAAIVVLALVGVLAGRSRQWARWLAVLVGLLVVTDVLHAVGTGLDVSGSALHQLWYTFAGSYYSIVAWVLGAVAIRLLARRSADGLFAALFTALVIGLFGGLADVIALDRSQVPYVLGTTVDRILITASLGVGAGVIIGTLFAFRRHRPVAPAAAELRIASP